MTTIGWIGTGNMASAIIRGITQKTQAYTMAYSPHLAEKAISRPEVRLGGRSGKGERRFISGGQTG
ncbi:MAG: hypothetical protein ACLSFJ_05360 [Holdemania filiformis]